MKVLFLGGPWHNERHEVMPTKLHRVVSLPVEYTVPVVAPDAVDRELTSVDAGGAGGSAPPRELVTYTRRYARAKGDRIPVYVAPDYHGPARA
jgi:hypothetical protein